MTYAGLCVSTFAKNITGTYSAEESIDGDEYIENQIRNFLDSDRSKYNGWIPLSIEYRTEPCKSIQILLYGKDQKLISDITDKAHFSNNMSKYINNDLSCNLLIGSDKRLLGYIPENSTIRDYLSKKPMIFGDAF